MFKVYSFSTHPVNPRDWGEGLSIVAAESMEEAIQLLGCPNYSHPDTGDHTGKLLEGVTSERKGVLESFYRDG